MSRNRNLEPLYYESHVTVNPVFGPELELFTDLCQTERFRPAKLLLQKRQEDTPIRSAKDSFATGHSKDFDDILGRMNRLCILLANNGFTVFRSKIEAVIVDSRKR